MNGLSVRELLGRKDIAEIKNNSNFADNENNRGKTGLDNRRTMRGSDIGETLAGAEKRDRISQTVATSNFAGNAKDVLDTEKREDLETRGLNPDWDITLFRKELREQAKQNGAWLDADYLNDKEQVHNYKIWRTSENDIYKNPDGKTLTKLNNLSYVKSGSHTGNLNAFIDRLNAHNILFLNSAYTIKGFMDNQNGFPAMVLEQAEIDAERNATQGEIEEYLTETGFKKDGKRGME